MIVLPQFIAFEVCPGWGLASVAFAGATREAGACFLWERCHDKYGATFRAMTADGIECGTPRPGAQHGVAGVLMERCGDCERMFVTPVVGAPLCPGCELLTVGSAELRRVE
jgi:hypothetical protein